MLTPLLGMPYRSRKGWNEPAPRSLKTQERLFWQALPLFVAQRLDERALSIHHRLHSFHERT